MRIPQSTVQSIADKTNIADVVGEYVSLKPQGGRLWGLCPFHGEKTPSFSVTTDKGLFYCFGCHKGGNVFTFVMEIEKLSFQEAAKLLAEKAGIRLDFDGDDREALRRSALQELYGRVAGSLHFILVERPEAAHARSYLSDRGFTAQTIEDFKIGYAPADRTWLYGFLAKRSYSAEFLRTSGLFTARNLEASLYVNRIMFPITDQHGNVIAFGGRTLDQSGPKYLNSPETEIFRKSENLFGLDKALPAIKETGSFVVVEGYTDLLALYQAGVRNVVAPLGTSFTEQQARRLRRYTERGVLLFDGDSAGKAAAMRAIPLCERVGIIPEILELPQDMDPAEILQKQGPEALHKLTKYPINSFVYLVGKALEKHDVRKPEGKESVLRELIPYIESIDSDVRKDASLSLLAEAIGVERGAVLRDYDRIAHDTKQSSALPVRKESVVSVELKVMLAVAVNRSYYPSVRSRLSTDDLEDDRSRELYVALEECFRRGDESTGGLLDAIEDEGLRDLVLSKLSSNEFSINPDRLIGESVLTIRRRSLEKKRSDLINRQRAAQVQNRPIEEIRSLQLDKMFLDGELEKLRIIENDRAAD